MKTVLQQQQKLNISMTPGLRQAIELLQYSTAELEQYIREQELENPLIELKEKSGTELIDGGFRRSGMSGNNTGIMTEAISAGEENTRDMLYENAKLAFSDRSTRTLLKFLIYNLDDNGYLSPLGQNPPYTDDQIEQGIRLLQTFCPIGTGARNLQECLLLQIEYSYPEEISAKILIEKHLELLAERRWKEISSRMKLSLADIKALYEFIQTLCPKPCPITAGSPSDFLIPDILVETINGQLTFKLNDSHLPDIQMNACYSPALRPKDEASKYIATQYQSYQWLLQSIEQRRSTIIKIVKILLDRQKDFFIHGREHLNPLTLKEAAEAIGMHESTVSRAISNKVIQTTFGSFELKQLFPSKLTNSEGSSISQTKVKSLMQQCISQENKQKPLSDQKIAEYLCASEGIPISRRTISKYREELRIPSASMRKEI